MHCGYDITGTFPDDQGRVICPECGLKLQRTDTHPSLTFNVMHKRFAKRLLLPTCAPPAVFMLCVWVPNLSIMWGMLYLPGMLAVSIIMWCITVPRTMIHARIHPRLIPRWKVLLWSFAYLLPQLAIEYAYWKISLYFIIPV